MYSCPIFILSDRNSVPQTAKKAAAAGAAVVAAALDKPRNITFKGATDLVTECVAAVAAPL